MRLKQGSGTSGLQEPGVEFEAHATDVTSIESKDEAVSQVRR